MSDSENPRSAAKIVKQARQARLDTHLTVEQKERLKRHSKATGQSMSQILRDLVDSFFSEANETGFF